MSSISHDNTRSRSTLPLLSIVDSSRDRGDASNPTLYFILCVSCSQICCDPIGSSNKVQGQHNYPCCPSINYQQCSIRLGRCCPKQLCTICQAHRLDTKASVLWSFHRAQFPLFRVLPNSRCSAGCCSNLRRPRSDVRERQADSNVPSTRFFIV
jgi:hypothetical protein